MDKDFLFHNWVNAMSQDGDSVWHCVCCNRITKNLGSENLWECPSRLRAELEDSKKANSPKEVTLYSPELNWYKVLEE